MRYCKKCENQLPIFKFSKRTIRGKIYYSGKCYACLYLDNKDKNRESKRKYDKKYREKNVSVLREYMANYRKLNSEKLNKYNSQYYKKNKSKISQYKTLWARQYREKNRILVNNNARNYYKKNRLKILSEIKAKRILTPMLRINDAISSGMYQSLRGAKGNRKWNTIVGYSLPELISHLEKNFTYGMSFDNYGEWHIDHIKPMSWFNFNSIDDDEFKECWSLKNLKPMWAKDNCSKGSRFCG